MSANRIYRKWIRSRWDESPFADLSKPQPNAQSLYVFLAIGPLTTAIPGVSRGGRATIADYFDWSGADVDRVFDELAALTGAVANWTAKLIFVPEAAIDDVPENPNSVKAWRRAFNELPGCDVKAVIDKHVHRMLIEQDLARPITDKEKRLVEHAWVRAWDPSYQPSGNVDETLAEPSSNVPQTLPVTIPEPGTRTRTGAGNREPEQEPDAGAGACSRKPEPEPAASGGSVQAVGWVGGVGEGATRKRRTCGCGATVYMLPTGAPGQYFDADGEPHRKTDACEAVPRLNPRKAAAHVETASSR